MSPALDDRPSQALRALGAILFGAWVVLAAPGLFERGALTGWIACAVALAAALALPGAATSALDAIARPRARTFVVVAATIAALASWLVISGPMRERVLSIDGTVYLFEARAFSHLSFGHPIPEPRLWFGGRFLFEGADGRLHGVFPPGFPLFVAPFAAIGAPLLVGPVVAVGLVLSQALLGRAIEGEVGVATRLGIVVSLPTFARAIETADLLSHAFVAALVATAIALAFLVSEQERRRGPLLGAAIGAAIGWATAARLLDGIVAGAIVASILVVAVARRRVPLLVPAAAILTFLPFLTLVLLHQKTSTGSWLVPTQSIYFARSDWPSTCHRLGFGVDVGCAVEHAAERRSFGEDGYGLADAFRVVRERASAVGGELLGLAPLAAIGVGVGAWRGRARDAVLAAWVVLLTVAYGLFYYGNAPIFGARHLFPIAPALWLLVGRAVDASARAFEDETRGARARAAVAVAVVAGVTAAMLSRWMYGLSAVGRAQHARVDVRSAIDAHGIDRGLVVTGDELSWIAAFDPARDGPERIVVRFDRSRLEDVRRTHPDLPVHAIVDGDADQSQQMPPPKPGLLVELERAWPSFVRPDGVGTKVINAKSGFGVDASGEQALFVFAAHPGASFSIPFTVPRAGRYSLRLDGMQAPDYGTWRVTLDGVELATWDGFAPEVGAKQGEPSAPRELAAGAHVLRFESTGRNAASTGHLGAFDALVGVPAP